MANMNNINMVHATMAYQVSRNNAEQVRLAQQKKQQENYELEMAQRMAMENMVYPFIGGNFDAYA